jgi:hypothetical protein
MSKFICAAAFAVVLLADLVTPAAAAIEYPWCAQYGGRSGGRNCGFTTYAQCMATVSGIGGFCERNQFYQGRSPRRH